MLSLSIQSQFAVTIVVFIKKTVASKFNLLATVFSFTVVFLVWLCGLDIWEMETIWCKGYCATRSLEPN